MSEATEDTLGALEHPSDASHRARLDQGDGATLSGSMGTSSLMLTVLAFSAPLAVVSGMIPFTIIFDGPGAPLAFLLGMVILLVFSVGYVTMTKRVPKPGDFYSFISTGLGNIPGMGAAFLALASYLLLLAGTYCFGGITVSTLIQSLHGPSTTWWYWTLLIWAVVSILGYFHIELSAKIMSCAMVLEICLVMIFNIFTIARGGADGFTLHPLSPAVFAKGEVGVALLFCMTAFMGFEATALFRDEVRKPNRTIPRATFGAVLLVGILYSLSAFGLVLSGGSHAVQQATSDPAAMFSNAIGRYVAGPFSQISEVLLVTSILAACISIHNVITRYAHNLSYDKALPRYMAKVNDRHGSPYRASILVTVLIFLIVAPLVIAKANISLLYGQLVGLGGVGVLFLMGLVSVAVIAWFMRARNPYNDNPLKVYVAPILATGAIAYTLVLAVTKFYVLVGGNPGQYDWMLILLAACFFLGVGLALYYRLSRPQVYSRLGRADRTVDLSLED